jgi:truncated hemoglobin YjbI
LILGAIIGHHPPSSIIRFLVFVVSKKAKQSILHSIMLKEERQALLRWGKTNAHSCYCNDPYPLDVTRISATPETIASIFAISDRATITVEQVDGNGTVELVQGKWPLEAQKEYTISTTDAMDGIIPIRKTFQLFPGKDEEEKTDRIHSLSKNFYSKIWHGKDTPEDFKKSFVNRVSSDEIQAYRQFNWFLEVFGGPSMFEEDGQGEKLYLNRTMAKHTASRMTLDHSLTWLRLMKQALDEGFPDDQKVKDAMGTYWLHFYAMFPFSDDEREEFRKLILGPDTSVLNAEQLIKETDPLNVEERLRGDGKLGTNA